MTDYISGANGFIGSHLARRLPEAVKVPHDDVLGVSGGRFFFLSSYGNMYGQDDVSQIVKSNVTDPIAVQAKHKSFIYASSSSVILKVQTPYSRCKRATEEVLLATGNACIIRPYSVTGVGEQKSHLIPTLIRNCLTGDRFEMTPWPRHDYIDVEDVVEAMLNLAPHTGVFDVGGMNSFSNMEVMEMVEQVTGKKANVQLVEKARPYDNVEWMCTSLSARQFGWHPQKKLRRSLEEMVDDFIESRTKDY